MAYLDENGVVTLSNQLFTKIKSELDTMNYRIEQLEQKIGGGEQPDDSVVVYDAKFEDIPSYLQNDVTSAINYLDTLNGYTNFAVLTDSHCSTNTGTSPSVSNYLLKQGKVDKIIHLGDIIDSGTASDSKWESAVNSNMLINNGNLLVVTGNHDYSLDKAVVFEATMSKAPVTHNPASGIYDWYYDNNSAKIRLIGIDYREGSMDHKWISSVISSIPNGYSYAILLHYTLPMANSAWEMCLSETNQTHLLNIIESSDKPFVGFFTGHQHLDETTQLANGAYHTTLLCDRFENLSYYSYYTYPTKTRGTDSEIAVTIVSINPTTRNVKFYRIGAANTEHSQWEYTYPEAIVIPEPDVQKKQYNLLEGAVPDTYIASGNGNQTSYSGWTSTGYLDCSDVSSLEIYLPTGSEGTYNWFYDTDKTPISRFQSTYMNPGVTTIDVPSGAKYFRMSLSTTQMNDNVTKVEGIYSQTK